MTPFHIDGVDKIAPRSAHPRSASIAKLSCATPAIHGGRTSAVCGWKYAEAVALDRVTGQLPQASA